ncbi:MAG: hypothetical protein ACRD9L_22815 [Bryobacteraceae bacterium]
MKLATLAVIFAAALAAQETSTEREAASDVLAKMAALEQSLNVPAWIAHLTAPDAERHRVVAHAQS